jgi:hypothetical protein
MCVTIKVFLACLEAPTSDGPEGQLTNLTPGHVFKDIIHAGEAKCVDDIERIVQNTTLIQDSTPTNFLFKCHACHILCFPHKHHISRHCCPSMSDITAILLKFRAIALVDHVGISGRKLRGACHLLRSWGFSKFWWWGGVFSSPASGSPTSGNYPERSWNLMDRWY